jgi:hypothetical protein
LQLCTLNKKASAWKQQFVYKKKMTLLEEKLMVDLTKNQISLKKHQSIGK